MAKKAYLLKVSLFYFHNYAPYEKALTDKEIP